MDIYKADAGQPGIAAHLVMNQIEEQLMKLDYQKLKIEAMTMSIINNKDYSNYTAVVLVKWRKYE